MRTLITLRCVKNIQRYLSSIGKSNPCGDGLSEADIRESYLTLSDKGVREKIGGVNVKAEQPLRLFPGVERKKKSLFVTGAARTAVDFRLDGGLFVRQQGDPDVAVQEVVSPRHAAQVLGLQDVHHQVPAFAKGQIWSSLCI